MDDIPRGTRDFDPRSIPMLPARARDADDVLELARGLVQHAIVRRLWILLLDGDGALRPQLQQVDGIPVSPDGHAALALRGILGLVAEPGAEAAFVLERPGGARPTPDDWAWRDAIVRAVCRREVPLRAVLLAHSAGVDRLEPEPPRTLAA